MSLLLLLHPRTVAPPTGDVTLSYVGAGAAPSGTGLPATGNTTATPNLPPTMADGNLVLVAVGSKPDTAGVTVSDPGWTFVGNGAGGTGVQGAGTGAVRESWYSRVKDASWTAMPDFTLDGTGNCLWAHAYVISADVTATYDVAMTSGVRTTESTAWSVTCSANPGFAAGDMVLFGGATAASLTASAEAITAPGATFAAATEIGEPKTTRNNDVGGFTAETTVTTGTATGAPTVTATMSASVGATGVSTVVRVRGVAVVTGPTTTVGSSQGTAWTTTAPVTSTRATTWQTRTPVTTTRASTWQTRATTTGTRTTTWAARATVTATQSASWATTGTATATQATTWDTLTPTSDTRATTWATSTDTTTTRTTTWGVSASVVPGHATVLASTSGTNTAPLPPGAETGDMILAYAFSSTATAPTLPTGWSNVTNNGSSPAFRLQYRVYDGVWGMPTFTNAAQVHAILIRGQATTTPAVSRGTLNATSATITWPASDTPQDLSGAAVFIRAAVHSNPGVVIPTPDGYTRLQGAGTSPGFISIVKDDTTTLGLAASPVANSAAYSRNTVEVQAAPVLTTVTDTRGTSWGTNAPVAATRAASWATGQPVTDTRAGTWATRAPVVGTRGSTWAVLDRTTSTRASTWATRTTTAAARATTWATSQQVTTTRGSTWNVAGTLATVTASRGTTWAVAGTITTVTATHSSTWNVAGALVTAARATTWAALARTTTTHATTWTARGTAVTTHATTWATGQRVTITRVTSWGVAGALFTVTASRGTTWNVAGALVTAARGSTWTTRAFTVTTHGASWTVRAPVAPTTRGTSWAILTPTTATRTTTWTTRAPVTTARVTTWTTRARFTTSHPATWDTLNRLTTSHAATWTVGITVTSTRGTLWAQLEVEGPIGRITGVRWYVLAASGDLSTPGAVGQAHTQGATGRLRVPDTNTDLKILEATGAIR